jgi:hypothetical protein
MKTHAGNSSGSRSSSSSASVKVICPLANYGCLAHGSRLLGGRDQGHELVPPTPLRAADEYLLTRRQMLGNPAPD